MVELRSLHVASFGASRGPAQKLSRKAQQLVLQSTKFVRIS
jgi:hypothetical protein